MMTDLSLFDSLLQHDSTMMTSRDSSPPGYQTLVFSGQTDAIASYLAFSQGMIKEYNVPLMDPILYCTLYSTGSSALWWDQNHCDDSQRNIFWLRRLSSFVSGTVGISDTEESTNKISSFIRIFSFSAIIITFVLISVIYVTTSENLGSTDIDMDKNIYQDGNKKVWIKSLLYSKIISFEKTVWNVLCNQPQIEYTENTVNSYNQFLFIQHSTPRTEVIITFYMTHNLIQLWTFYTGV